MPKLIEIEGLGPVYAEKLKQYGVRSFDDLLKNAATHKGRKEMSAAIGVSEKNLLEWATLADLMRIRGISLAYAVLLAACGVDNTHELALRDPQKLHDQMIGVNKRKIW